MSAPGPMTEAAFRRAFAEAYCGTGKVFETDATADAAVAAAKAAGMAFAPEAPEAPALPEQIHWAIDCWHLSSGNEVMLPTIVCAAPQADKVVYAEACRRYNEYGKLRRAVEREITAILHHHTLQWPYRTDALPQVVARLNAALAEGAQP